MRNRFEIPDDPENQLLRNAHCFRNRNRSQDIFIVAAADKIHIIRPKQHFFFTVFSAVHGIALKEITVQKLRKAGEPPDLRRESALPECAEPCILIIQDNHILRTRIFDNAFLDFGVAFHRMVTVQMVRRDIENRRNMRPEGLDRLKLERRKLNRRHGIRSRPEHFLRIGESDVSGRKCPVCSEVFAHNIADERGRRRFAVRTGDADHRTLFITPGKLDLGDDPDARILKLHGKRHL